MFLPHQRVITAHEMSENEAAFHEAVKAIRERSPQRIAEYLRTDIQGA